MELELDNHGKIVLASDVETQIFLLNYAPYVPIQYSRNKGVIEATWDGLTEIDAAIIMAGILSLKRELRAIREN